MLYLDFVDSIHSNLDITNKSIILVKFLFTLHYIKCNMLSKSSKWELGWVHCIAKFIISRFIISRFECITICPDPSYLNLLTFWSRKSQKSWVKHIKSQEKSTTFILQLWNMTWLVFNDTTHVTKKRAELNSMIFLCLQKIIMIIFFF